MDEPHTARKQRSHGAHDLEPSGAQPAGATGGAEHELSSANGWAFIWGFAEATFFFIVPDVWLSWLALRRARCAFIACVYALIGALIGGALMWTWARHAPESARALLLAIPGLDASLVDHVRPQLAEHGMIALFIGAFSGVPYKIYAVEASALQLDFRLWLLMSVPARMARFLLVTGVAAVAARTLRNRMSLTALRAVHVTCWLMFYVVYFSVST